MRANYQSKSNNARASDNVSLLWVFFDGEKEAAKAEKTVEVLVGFGYGVIHVDAGECYMLAGDPELTRDAMRADFAKAKRS